MSQNLSALFNDKVVLITGAASGIGQALAVELASLGAKLILCDIEEVKAPPTSEALVLKFDVADTQAWSRCLKEAAEHFGHIDIIINNAGIEGAAKPVWATDETMLRRVMDINFFGMANGSRLGLPYLVSRPWAALVNVSSIFGFVGVPNGADYCASKFAIRGFTESLRAELLQVHPHVQIHSIHPGGINTKINRQPHTQSFKHKFLKTQPRDLAMHIIEQIEQNAPRIVFGHQAKSTYWASRLLPLAWINRLTIKAMRSLNMKSEYQPDHPGFSNKREE